MDIDQSERSLEVSIEMFNLLQQIILQILPHARIVKIGVEVV